MPLSSTACERPARTSVVGAGGGGPWIGKAAAHFAGRDKEDGDGDLCLPYDTPDFVHERQEEFWRYFRVVSGRDVPEGYEGGFIHCSC